MRPWSTRPNLGGTISTVIQPVGSLQTTIKTLERLTPRQVTRPKPSIEEYVTEENNAYQDVPAQLSQQVMLSSLQDSEVDSRVQSDDLEREILALN